MTEFIYLNSSKRLIACVNLGVYKEQLEPYGYFMRVHRSHIINLKMVVKYNKGENYVIMINGDIVPVSKSNSEGLSGRMGEL